VCLSKVQLSSSCLVQCWLLYSFSEANFMRNLLLLCSDRRNPTSA